MGLSRDSAGVTAISLLDARTRDDEVSVYFRPDADVRKASSA